MKKLTPIKPYSDNKLEWNEDEGQYFLTFEYCNENYEHNFADDDILKKRIKKNSHHIYNYIKAHVNSRNIPIVTALLYRTKEGRDFIFDLLSTQFEADVETGYNDLGKTPAINVSNGQIIDRNEIRRNLITVETEQIFDNSYDYFGINLSYQAVFPAYYYYFLGR